MALPLNYREGFDEAIVNMYSNPTYANSYLFYASLLGQCSIVFDEKLPAPAGVNFTNDHFNLYINPCGIDLDKPIIDDKGNEITHMPGFNEHPLEQRLAILKHEMLHILNDHIHRSEDRDHSLFNGAADCAINQFIDKSHLPEGCILPENLIEGKSVPAKLTSEQYYEIAYEYYKQNPDQQPTDGQGSGQGDHSKWEESTGDADLQKDITKNMLNKAADQTAKSRGNIPSEFSDWLSFFSTKREVDWRQVLKNIVGNKRINIRRTIQRQDRRLPNFEWIKGKTKDRQFNLLVVSDVSGSVGEDALLSLWSEVRNICTLFNSELNLIQVDTHASSPEKLTKTTRKLERKACGGTVLKPALDKAKEHHLDFDAIVVTTDGYIDDSDIAAFAATKRKVIWLIEKDGQIQPAMTSGAMRAFQLKE